MNDDHLQSWLRHAEPDLSRPALDPTELAECVRALHHRRQQRTYGAASVCVLLLLLGAWRWHALLPAAPRVTGVAAIASNDPAEPADATSVDALIESAEAEIKCSRQIVARLMAAERLALAEIQIQRSAAWPLSMETAAANSERAARAIMLAAEHKAQSPRLASSIEQDCKMIVELFPLTPEADQARRRLSNPLPSHMP